MKKNLLLALVLLSNFSICLSKSQEDFTDQDFAKYNIDDFDGVSDGKADFITAALNIKSNFGLDKQGYISQTTVIECPNMNKQDIYVQAKIWMESFCNNDKRAELRLDGNQGSTLIARKRVIDVAGKEFRERYGLKRRDMSGSKINLLVNIRVDVKDGKCRLTTTIEDYGIQYPTNNGGVIGGAVATGGIGSLIGAAVGSAVANALNVEQTMKPVNHFPFKENEPFRAQKEGESDEKYLKKKEKHEAFQIKVLEYDKSPAVAYVASFLITQIVHDKMLEAITSAPSFENNDNW